MHEYEICQHLGNVFFANWDQLSPAIRERIDSGRSIKRQAYYGALDQMTSVAPDFTRQFESCGAIISPSALREAPGFGPFTGDPVCCSVWTTAGLPALNLPLQLGGNSWPIGVQVIGGVRQDGALIRAARWRIGELKAK